MLVPNPKVALGNAGMLQAGTDKPGPTPPTGVLGREGGVDGSWLRDAGSLR